MAVNEPPEFNTGYPPGKEYSLHSIAISLKRIADALTDDGDGIDHLIKRLIKELKE